MLLETGVRPIELLTLQRVYKYITKVNNMPNLRLHILLGMLDVSDKRIIRVKFSHPVGLFNIRKWFRRWGVDLLELSGNAMHYVMIEERLV